MSAKFAERWKAKWAECGFEDVGIELIPCGSDVLPDSAAPCLNFDRTIQPAPIWEVFGIPSQWPPADRERLAQYRVIGSDGSGNPICIDETSGAVVILEHENRFQTLEFMNSSVRQLAECLLAYMGESDSSRFRLTVLSIDPAAVAPRTFWWHSAASLADEDNGWNQHRTIESESDAAG